MNDHHSDPAAAKPEDPASRPAPTPEVDTPSAPANSDDAGTAASAGADTSMPRWPGSQSAPSADEAPRPAESSNVAPPPDSAIEPPSASASAVEPPTPAASDSPTAGPSATEPSRSAEPPTAAAPTGQPEPATQAARLGPLPPNGPAPGSRPPLPPNATPGYPAGPPSHPNAGFPAGPPTGAPGGPPHVGPPTGPIPMVGPSGHPVGAVPAKPRSKAPLLLAAALVVALGAGAVGGVTGYALAGAGDTSASSPSELVADGKTISDIAKKVQPSVVSIATENAGGSGVVYDDSGHIITNNHVAETAKGGKLEVSFADGSTSSASVVGTDPAGDLAVIKVDDTANLAPIKMGDSGGLEVGDTVLAIGSPLGLDGSVTSGIVSALDRTVQAGGGEQGGQPTTLKGLVQTDAAINPGNSGGALVNGKGELIGINTIIATTGGSEGSVGLGFAIPSSTVASTTDQLIKGGDVEHGYLGVGVADNVEGAKGAVISNVEADSPAAEAGLKRGDVITAINGEDITSASDVGAQVMNAKPGTKVEITYKRDGKEDSTTATLGSANSKD